MSDTSIAAPELLARVRAEQAVRWRSGDRPSAEELLARHPELAANPVSAQIVVYGEVLLREELDGAPPDPTEYAVRFPAHAEALALQFELHGELAGSAAVPQLPGFEIVRELGHGGMGAVYLAREAVLDRLVAVKVLLSGEFASALARKRFRAEAEAVARLRHPHIVTVHAVGEHAGRPYLVLEYISGGSLDRRLNGTPLDPRVAAELIRPLADAVEQAHVQGVIHRDIKPANVLLSGFGFRVSEFGEDTAGTCPRTPNPELRTLIPKIADFGLAKRLDLGDGPTATSQVLGTPSYMAPEQATGAKEVGPAADIYALGAILYECLTGRPPFKAATALETLAHVTGREPAAPRSLNPAVPRDLETICLKCLAKEPAKRYASAEALADDLGRFLDGKPVVARPVGPLGRTWRLAKRKPAVAGLATALVVLLPAALGGITALYFHADAQRQLAQERERDSRDWRQRNAIAMSDNALSLVMALYDQSAIDACRACIEEFDRLAAMGLDSPESRARRANVLDQLSYTLCRHLRTQEALQAGHAAVEAYTACVAEQPTSPRIRAGMRLARQNLASAFRVDGRHAEAATLLDDIIAEYHATYGPCLDEKHPQRGDLTGAYFDRGMCRYHLRRPAEAVLDYDEALRRDNGRHWAELTLARANALAHCGRVAEALEACGGPLANPHVAGIWVYDAALVHAVASQATQLTPEQRRPAADRTIELLRWAIAAEPRWRTAIRRDTEFDPFRDRPDFRALLAQ